MKHQDAGGQDQFGGAVLGAGAGGVTPVAIDELESYFDSLATAATTDKTT